MQSERYFFSMEFLLAFLLHYTTRMGKCQIMEFKCAEHVFVRAAEKLGKKRGLRHEAAVLSPS